MSKRLTDGVWYRRFDICMVSTGQILLVSSRQAQLGTVELEAVVRSRIVALWLEMSGNINHTTDQVLVEDVSVQNANWASAVTCRSPIACELPSSLPKPWLRRVWFYIVRIVQYTHAVRSDTCTYVCKCRWNIRALRLVNAMNAHAAKQSSVSFLASVQ